jgi:hypothetical protein
MDETEATIEVEHGWYYRIAARIFAVSIEYLSMLSRRRNGLVTFVQSIARPARRPRVRIRQ